MRISVQHVTRYSYAEAATYSIQSLRLTPSNFTGQTVIDWRVESEPAATMMASRDGFGNVIHLMTVDKAHTEIAIHVSGLVEVEDRNGIVAGLTDIVPLRVYLRHTELTKPEPSILALTRLHDVKERIPYLHELMESIRDRVDYVPDVTHSETTAAEALAAGTGVCQDHAHIFLAAVRASGIPARYVTGYLLLDDKHLAEAHHAWAEAWVDGLGWLAFDVANRICPTDRYVRMAASLDAHYTAPIRGSRRGGGDEALAVEVQVSESTAQSQTQSQQSQSQSQKMSQQ